MPTYCVCTNLTVNNYPSLVPNDNNHQTCNSLCISTCTGSDCSYCGSSDGLFASSYFIGKLIII